MQNLHLIQNAWLFGILMQCACILECVHAHFKRHWWELVWSDPYRKGHFRPGSTWLPGQYHWSIMHMINMCMNAVIMRQKCCLQLKHLKLQLEYHWTVVLRQYDSSWSFICAGFAIDRGLLSIMLCLSPCPETCTSLDLLDISIMEP